MLHIKMPFGYNSICLDHCFVLHTGKIRIKSSIGDCYHALGHHPQLLLQEGSNGCTTIRFSTTCHQTNDFLIKEINAMLCKIMHERIDAKYAPKKWEPEMVDMTNFIAM
jgi:hypothetical protein